MIKKISHWARKDKRQLDTYLLKGVDDFVSNFGFRHLVFKRITFEESAEFKMKTATAKNACDHQRLSEYSLLSCLMLRWMSKSSGNNFSIHAPKGLPTQASAQLKNIATGNWERPRGWIPKFVPSLRLGVWVRIVWKEVFTEQTLKP